jgi:hypothetical protein
MSNNKNQIIVSIKLFLVIISFLCYKYLYFFIKVILKRNLKRIVKNANCYSLNIYFLFY